MVFGILFLTASALVFSISFENEFIRNLARKLF